MSLFFYKGLELVGGGFVINRAYLSSLVGSQPVLKTPVVVNIISIRHVLPVPNTQKTHTKNTADLLFLSLTHPVKPGCFKAL